MPFARETGAWFDFPMRGAPPPEVSDEPVLSKATVQVALVMALIVVLGVLGVGGLLKLHGYDQLRAVELDQSSAQPLLFRRLNAIRPSVFVHIVSVSFIRPRVRYVDVRPAIRCG
jgi:hypothetical protein